jgi:CRISPR-associated protein Csm1
MDDTVLKIALAGLLHDIGKFAQEGMFVSPEFINNHRQLYQPYYNEQFTHLHVIYTAAFIDHVEKLLPEELNKANWGMDDPFINLASGHHKPQTSLQWIIAMADRLSSGWDRANFEEYNQSIAWKDYRQTRLLPLFEVLLRDDEKKAFKREYRYPLMELNPKNIFPYFESDKGLISDEQGKVEYKALFDDFVYSLEKLLHKDANIALWFEHLESLLLIYTSMIPAARAGKIVPDVSLYDHSKAVAAIASALYLYHRDTDSMNVAAICDSTKQKFYLIGGDFYGIQDFIFSDSGEAGKHRSKILRGRSFAVSLLCELAADMICRETGLPLSSVLLNVAGKFTIIAPNTNTVKEAVAKAQARINDWLIRKTLGVNAFGVSMIEVAPRDFESGQFHYLYDRLSEKMGANKYKKFNTDTYAGVVEGFLDTFDNGLNPPLCPYCGKRPSSRSAEALKKDKDDKSMCSICRDHIFLGENIVKKTRIAVTTADADIKGNDIKLIEPFFGEYQVAFIEGELNKLAREGKLLKYWDISIDAAGKVAKDVTARFINGYVPIYGETDLYDDRILEGRKGENKKEEMIEGIKEGRPKTFSHLACKAMNPGLDGNRSFTGIQALGVLKADVDHLGMLMSCGISEKQFTISRLATMSRQLNFFFVVYLPYLLKTNPSFRDVYTVFAGGDDLFLIGPWNRILDLSEFLKVRFAEYVCGNADIHFSAGISIQKANIPLSKMAADAEAALAASKDSGRNRLTVFGETVTWDDFSRLHEITKIIEIWRDEKLINNAMLFRLNRFIRMAAEEKAVLGEKEIHLEDMGSLKWRAMFSYNTERNIGKNIKDEAKRTAAKKEFEKVAGWLSDYGSNLKIAIWDIIYNNR